MTHRISIAIALLLVLGCRSVPTSSEGVARADGSSGKGGTISCSEGFSATTGPDGALVPSCDKNLVWADPPTAEETQGVMRAVEVIFAPLDKIAVALARLIPGGD